MHLVAGLSQIREQSQLAKHRMGHRLGVWQQHNPPSAQLTKLPAAVCLDVIPRWHCIALHYIALNGKHKQLAVVLRQQLTILCFNTCHCSAQHEALRGLRTSKCWRAVSAALIWHLGDYPPRTHHWWYCIQPAANQLRSMLNAIQCSRFR